MKLQQNRCCLSPDEASRHQVLWSWAVATLQPNLGLLNLLASLDVLWDHQPFTLCCWDNLLHVWWCFYSGEDFYWGYLLVSSSVSFPFASPLFLLCWRWALLFIKWGSMQNSLTITLYIFTREQFMFWFCSSNCSKGGNIYCNHGLEGLPITFNTANGRSAEEFGCATHTEICTFLLAKAFM